jgi:ABC-2 type transport system permease protein
MMTKLPKYISRFTIDSVMVVVVAIVILASILSQQFFFRIDLTSEKRYTLSDDTKEILSDLDDIVFIRVYLEGELNIPFRKFQENIHDMLDELKVYGGSRLQYEFVNPFEDADAKKQGQILEELYNKGLRPTNIYQRDKEGGNSEKIIFPAAMVSYKKVEVPLNLLLNNSSLAAEQNLNNSIEALEYSLVSTIKTITNHKIEKIAFLEGQGELNEFEVNDISRELSKMYQIDRGMLNGKPGILDEYKALIIAKPTLPFTEPDKFVLDQYIMNGGKVLWLIDAVQISIA